MQPADVSNLTTQQKEKISRTARRSPSSEAALIFGAGGALIAVVSAVFAMPVFGIVAANIGMSSTFLWVFVSFGTSLLWSVIHAQRLKPKIANAQDLDAAVQYAQEQERKREVQSKIDAMGGGMVQ